VFFGAIYLLSVVSGSTVETISPKITLPVGLLIVAFEVFYFARYGTLQVGVVPLIAFVGLIAMCALIFARATLAYVEFKDRRFNA
jgi:hypothetical protein